MGPCDSLVPPAVTVNARYPGKGGGSASGNQGALYPHTDEL